MSTPSSESPPPVVKSSLSTLWILFLMLILGWAGSTYVFYNSFKDEIAARNHLKAEIETLDKRLATLKDDQRTLVRSTAEQLDSVKASVPDTESIEALQSTLAQSRAELATLKEKLTELEVAPAPIAAVSEITTPPAEPITDATSAPSVDTPAAALDDTALREKFIAIRNALPPASKANTAPTSATATRLNQMFSGFLKISKSSKATPDPYEELRPMTEETSLKAMRRAMKNLSKEDRAPFADWLAEANE